MIPVSFFLRLLRLACLFLSVYLWDGCSVFWSDTPRRSLMIPSYLPRYLLLLLLNIHAMSETNSSGLFRVGKL